MHIWLAPSAFFPARGGVEELTLQLAREYQRRGHEVTVVVHHHPVGLPRAESIEGVAVRRLEFDLPGAKPGRVLGYPVNLARQVRDLSSIDPRPDVIHVQCPSNQMPAISAFAWRRRIPLVVTTQGEVTMDADEVYQRSAQMRLALKLGVRVASTLTACSRRAGNDAATVAPRFKDSLVIPNGVDVSQWEVTPTPDQPTFAAWGRHVPQKGFDLLIEAFALVKQQLPAAVLRIGGDGPETQALRELAGDGVEFLGPLSRAGVHDLLRLARVAVVPSRLEPFGIVAVEAMAAGRGVIWSTVGGLADATGGLGWGIDPKDRTATAAAMIEACERPLDPWVARDHAETLSWPRIVDQYMAQYEQLLLLP